MNKYQDIKLMAIGFLKAMKTLWFTTIDILQLFVYSFLLHALIEYFKEEYQLSLSSMPFVNLAESLAQNWVWFFIAIFLLRTYHQWRFFK